jgi:nitrite reductase/ring-hydroxylating ferredoxin subunit
MDVESPPLPRRIEAPGGACGVSAFARAELERVAFDFLAHRAAETIPLAPELATIAAEHYTDPALFEVEQRRIFRRIPLMLAPSCEIPRPGDYKTMEVAGVPILLTRGRDGQVRTFLNACTHRASAVARGCGAASRFVCPYHGWTFDREGSLVGIASSEDFGPADKSRLGLKRFPSLERAGLIWAVLDPASKLDIGAFVGGFGDLLAAFGFEDWTFVESRSLKGPNWKLAFDAHLEFYHIPVLHRATFGPDRSNRALYYQWGPHQRLLSPGVRPGAPDQTDLLALADRPPAAWPTDAMMLGEWIIFPGISINSFHEGGRGVFLSQVFPGERVGESITVQSYLTAEPPDAAAREKIHGLCDFLAHVVGEEDLPTSTRQQQALATGLVGEVRFGRNEGGLQHFHRWSEAIVTTSDEMLPDLFAA